MHISLARSSPLAHIGRFPNTIKMVARLVQRTACDTVLSIYKDSWCSWDILFIRQTVGGDVGAELYNSDEIDSVIIDNGLLFWNDDFGSESY